MTSVTGSADCRALLRGICENPESDLPRLVLADWLDELDDKAAAARADLIREHVHSRYRHEGTDGAALVFGVGRFVVVAPATPGVTWVTSRGFVSGVTLTLAAFAGGPCGRCGGVGQQLDHVVAYGSGPPCDACDGTGRVAGCAEALFRTHPITAVTLSDVAPYPVLHVVRYEVGSDFLFFGMSHIDASYRNGAVLPDAVMAHMHKPRHDDIHEAGFHSVSAAMDALSAACVAYGRGLAGLPPIGGV